MLNNRMDRIKLISILALAVEFIVALFFKYILKMDYNFLVYVCVLVNAGILTYIFYVYETEKRQRNLDISRVLGNEAKEAFDYGQIGIIVYDENYIVTWANEFFDEIGLSIIGEKITKAIPGLHVLFNGNSDTIVLDIDDKKYEFMKSEADQVVYMKDVTEITALQNNYENEQVVLGLVNLDNYSDVIQNEDEQTIAAINTNIRQKVVEWTVNFGGAIRRVRSDKFFIVINKKHFQSMLDSKFAILSEVKQEADKLDVAITLSMGFSYGSSSISEIDSTVNSLLELVLSRGGDQVAVKEIGKEVVFYGTSSAASEKTSKVKARYMASGLNGLIQDSDKIFIVPHRDADLDAFGSCLGLSRIAQLDCENTYIVMDQIAIEPKTMEIYSAYMPELVKTHQFISQAEAITLMDESSLVIVSDHHSIDLTSCPELVEKAKKIVIIDHHRRRSDTAIAAVMIYNEPACSSTGELVSELIQYQNKELELTDLEASIIYAGVLVDTDGLKSRCSTRTFEACAFLKKSGADVTMVNDWLRESLNDFMNKATITKYMEVVDDGIIVSAVNIGAPYLSRTALAQGANYICDVKEVKACVVLGNIDANTIAVCARSTSDINVQLIMEKMGGGGHFNAAGLQRTGSSISTMREEVIQAIKEYQQQGGNTNESSTIS